MAAPTPIISRPTRTIPTTVVTGTPLVSVAWTDWASNGGEHWSLMQPAKEKPFVCHLWCGRCEVGVCEDLW